MIRLCFRSTPSPVSIPSKAAVVYLKLYQTDANNSVQNYLQFDSEYTLDVQSTYLYPFDTYTFTSTVLAVPSDTETNSSLPILGLPVIGATPTFIVSSSDSAAAVATGPDFDDSPSTSLSCRNIDMYIRRPNASRAYTMLLFAVSWALTHFSWGVVVLALHRSRSPSESKDILKYSAGLLVIMLVMPQLRACMPDAPELEGACVPMP